MTKWTETKEWKANWEYVREIASGGQGAVYEAKHKENRNSACLKTLSRQKDYERRARFFREATAYDTCNHSGIPQLIESNAASHSNLEFKLYIATEFIHGPTLSEFVDRHGRLSLANAQELVGALLQTLDYIHSNGWMHRDIKPDNIVLRNSSFAKPVLVDFGLCFKKGTTEDFATEHGQELGNRFLRLPELSPESTTKQDVRTDLAFTAAIFLYALTGSIPATLLDAEGRMPHQRVKIRDLLTAGAGPHLHPLLSFFDRSLNHRMHNRHDSARSMRAALDIALSTSTAGGVASDDENRDLIRAIVQSGVVPDRKRIREQCDRTLEIVRVAHREVAKQAQPCLESLDYGLRIHTTSYEVELGFIDPAGEYWTSAVHTFHVRPIEAELVVECVKGVLDRAPTADAMKDLHARATTLFLALARQLLEKPGPHLLDKGFFNAPPFASLEAGRKAAGDEGKLVFCVVYDMVTTKHQELERCVGFFMEHAPTKLLVSRHFKVAFVESGEARQANILSDDEPLQTPRWIVLSLSGAVIRNEPLYANADEGLKRVRSVISQEDGAVSF